MRVKRALGLYPYSVCIIVPFKIGTYNLNSKSFNLDHDIYIYIYVKGNREVLVIYCTFTYNTEYRVDTTYNPF